MSTIDPPASARSFRTCSCEGQQPASSGSPHLKGSRADDIDIARRLLAGLPEVERRALGRYYSRTESNSHIEQSLNLERGRIAELHMELRKRFFATLLVERPWDL